MRVPNSSCDNQLTEIYICGVGAFADAGRDVHVTAVAVGAVRPRATANGALRGLRWV
jgi:hypothetical protein